MPALFYVLQSLEDEGHTAFERTTLLDEAARLLDAEGSSPGGSPNEPRGSLDHPGGVS